MSNRPQTEEELQTREAIGVIRASRFIRRFAKSRMPITIVTICEIHKEIFKDAWPEIAGKYRDENLSITGSELVLPHYTDVRNLMEICEQNLLERIKTLNLAEGTIEIVNVESEEMFQALDGVVALAAWIHHVITVIHPFREGNGRTARLASNLILERYGLVGISIKIEKENKHRYRQALVQIDTMKDYEPLKSLIYEGLIDRYHGVSMRYYESAKPKKK